MPSTVELYRPKSFNTFWFDLTFHLLSKHESLVKVIEFVEVVEVVEVVEGKLRSTLINATLFAPRLPTA